MRARAAEGARKEGDVAMAYAEPVAPRAVVTDMLRRMAHLQVRLDALEADLQEAVERVQAGRGGRIAATRARLEGLARRLEAVCRAERDALIPPGRKGLDIEWGRIGFRAVGPAVGIRVGTAERDVCRALRRAGLRHLVRTRETPDATAVRKALSGGMTDRRTLSRCGLEVQDRPDSFHYAVRLLPDRHGRAKGGDGR
jgi:phage host-nuclease inhibitor protein Gam